MIVEKQRQTQHEWDCSVAAYKRIRVRRF